MTDRSGEKIQLVGPVTVETVPALVAEVTEHLRQGVRTVDFSRVDEVDSSAVALALEWQRQAEIQQQSVTLVNIPDAMRNLANLYGVADLMGPGKA